MVRPAAGVGGGVRQPRRGSSGDVCGFVNGCFECLPGVTGSPTLRFFDRVGLFCRLLTLGVCPIGLMIAFVLEAVGWMVSHVVIFSIYSFWIEFVNRSCLPPGETCWHEVLRNSI